MTLNDLNDLLDFKVNIIKDGNFTDLGFLVNDDTDVDCLLSFCCSIGYKINSSITSIITTKDVYSDWKNKGINQSIGIILDENPKALFFKIYETFLDLRGDKDNFKSKISERANIHKSAYIDEEGVIVKEGVTISANATILSGTIIEKNSFIGSGTVIGNDGFSICEIDGVNRKIRHSGKVLIKSSVNIGANSVIDKALFSYQATTISSEAMLDGCTFIAHNVFIGEKTLIAAGSIVSGNVQLGKNVYLGPDSVISNRVKVGENSIIRLGSVVIRNLKSNSDVSGNFAVSHKKNLIRSIKEK